MGTATITAKTTDGNFEATCLVTVEPINAAAPAIAQHPQSATLNPGTTHDLSVTATSPDGGTLSYQWYAGATAITGATNNTYAAPITEEGEATYYVIVTNQIAENGDGGTKTATVTSNTATITVNNRVNAQAPTITAQPQNASHRQGATASPLTVAATSPDGGTISGYQWYTGETAIAGETSTSYIPPTATVGTQSYYAVAINAITDNGDGGAKTATAESNVATITITPPAASITLNHASLTLTAGAAATLTATILPNDVANKTVNWSSSNPAAATVAGGVVTAVAGGSATITATSADDNSKTATCEVTVTQPATATNKSVTWESSDPTVASYDNGVVTAHKLGNATITATTADGGFTATCEVEVNNLENAQSPIITLQPQSANYVQNAEAAALDNAVKIFYI
jgi:uncharacterized protein YjdB